MARSWNEGQVIGECLLRSGAFAISNKLHRRWLDHAGNWYHHLLDPRTGLSSTSPIVQATVRAERAIDADVYAKCLCLLEVEEALEWTKTHHRAHEIWLVDERKQVYHWQKDDHSTE